MDASETILGSLIALVLIAVAVYFAWRQWRTIQTLSLESHLPVEQRRYLRKQTARRLFCSLLMLLLAAMLIGSFFLDYENMKTTRDQPVAEQEAAKETARLIGLYWMIFLLMLMVLLALAVIDLWATARFGVQQHKQLAKEHQDTLQADLARLKQRRSELN